MIHTGDCLDVMATLDAESIDAIVTDPPYDLTSTGARKGSPRIPGTGPYSRGFMGKAWDGTGVAFRPETWAAAYRVAKPSAYLLAFGGTRTVHRLASAIEDAGWIIRDLLVWGYASGFPKSKASLKPAWEPIVMARKPGPLRMLNIDECRIDYVSDDERAEVNARVAPNARYREQVGGGVTGAMSKLGERHVDDVTHPSGRWPANIVLTDPIFDGGWDGVVGGGDQDSGPRAVLRDSGSRHSDFHMGASERETYGDSGTYSRFFQIGVDSCDWCGAPTVGRSSRQSSDPDGSAPSHAATATDGPTGSIGQRTASPPTSGTGMTSWLDDDGSTPSIPRSRRPGTSPASTLPSDPARSMVVGRLGTVTTTTMGDLWTCVICAGVITSPSTVGAPDHPWAFIIPKADRSDREPVLGGLPTAIVKTQGRVEGRTINDDGSITSHGDTRRARANVHPTVKPVDLMRHLVRLVTPQGGTVLDPFLGSGTTGVACEMEGFPWIGIEKEPEYVAIAEARLLGIPRGLGLDVA